MLKPDCLDQGKDISHKGSRYNRTFNVEICGGVNLVNSLASIRENIFEEQHFTLDKLKEAIAANFGYVPAGETGSYSLIEQVKTDDWQDWLKIHKQCLDAPKYGNDDPYVDEIFREWQIWFADLCENYRSLYDEPLYPCQISVSIQGMSVHDGPGCRTLIFLSGCTLQCSWCSNPEGISPKPALLYDDSKCILCGNCLKNCPMDAISFSNNTNHIDRHICSDCQTPICLQECYTDALRLAGYEISVEELMKKIQRDRPFWGDHGGITLTGGEPLFQIDFAEKILARCHDSYIHTTIETAGNVSWEHFLRIIPYTDFIFFDLKHINPLHHWGREKYALLGLENDARRQPVPTLQSILDIQHLMKESDIECYVGSAAQF